MEGRMWGIVLSCVAVCVAVLQAAKLPPYMSRCSWSAPVEEISACAQKNANIAAPKFEMGDKKYRIPVMHPLVVPRISIAQGTNQIGITLTWSPAKLWGLNRAKISNMVVNVEKQHTGFDISFPKFVISGPYTAGGRILLLPITGKGDSNITLINLKAHYEYDWPVKKGQDGKEYASIQNGSVKIVNVDSMTIRLEGLFGGDRLLSDNMHTFLNENWKEVIKEIGPGVAEAVGEVVKLVVANLAHTVPINDMFINSPF